MINEELKGISEKVQTISYTVIGRAIEVHRQLGPGLLESAYKECLFYEIKKAGLKVEKEITPHNLQRNQT
jgi:GxxExxY protein